MMEKAVLTAEETLERFLKCWKSCKWLNMLQCCQETWIYTHQNALVYLTEVFGERLPVSWEILETEKVGNACVDVNVQINFHNNSGTRAKVRLICETDPYTPDLNGSWGVNPISAYKLFRGK